MDEDNNSPAEDNQPSPGGDDDTVTIQWRDLEFVVPKDRAAWDMNVQFEFEDGRRVRAIFMLLGGGPDGLSAVRSKVYAAAKTSGELDDFMKHTAEVLNKECVGVLP